ncbi:hypothetical protein A3K29_05000 [Candidatus Collierbacteria bacterium RIFOXYB2_FULL_46_14]|uniref:Peptidase M50 n=1 Tax=Candidatus Collierbacteria bacterium GW2011_GWA2_46_26 TaxID=1618381 RepID=A0A0G1SIA0_9BACT|nr:MAG: Peptidase M50 [Candidatus Collierbacteria bacterium GW2011_GWA2_46_26]OGD73454.1 MAG: hypothetical protein A3K29_05000 [Candidatus Collierbacteria bacterium RIFOXYB2_FULL_46_14]OGD76496.1 MAG: hypothetical protein A3K43_05000 [Candidatus Collierbacteria bacterium RIFOXYA2_FULL_46_20]OGD77832.1 MAG: hypothetical protein A3K39_05000 [Candidatus Collierbacteria bacterium RIFOXYC2_FULL_43_15]OGD81123.1 MAG: hypothetical protein A2320_05500 [Pseudomonadales bacterium GWC2_63_15]OGD82554.1 M
MVLQIILLFVLSVILHEAGHALVAIAQGYKLKKFYIGIPVEFRMFGRNLSTIVFKKQMGSVEFGISALILGGAVDFYDLDDAPFWHKFWIIIAGPLTNLMLGFLPLLFFYDLGTSLHITYVICSVVLSALGSLFGGSIPLSQIAGPVGAMNSMVGFASGYSNGLLLLWVVLNLAFFVTNMLPIPAIDGGQLLTSSVVAILGKKWKKPMDTITLVFFYILMIIMAIILTKDLW